MAEYMNGCRKQDVKIIHKRKHLKKSCNDKEFLCIKRYCLTELKKKMASHRFKGEWCRMYLEQRTHSVGIKKTFKLLREKKSICKKKKKAEDLAHTS